MKTRTPRQEEVQRYHGERFMLQGSLANIERIANNTQISKEFKAFKELVWKSLKSKYNIKTL
jgi:hypothetical protein